MAGKQKTKPVSTGKKVHTLKDIGSYTHCFYFQ